MLVTRMEPECPEGVALVEHILSKYPKSVMTGIIMTIMAIILWTTGVVAADRCDRNRRRRRVSSGQGAPSSQAASEWRYQQWPNADGRFNSTRSESAIYASVGDTPPPSYEQLMRRFIGNREGGSHHDLGLLHHICFVEWDGDDLLGKYKYVDG